MAPLKEANAMLRRQVCLILAGILTLSIPAGGGFSQVIRRPGSETQSTQPQQWTGRAKFTHFDDLAIGTLASASKAAWVIAIDEDAPGDLGRFYIRGGKTNGIAQQFDAFYTKFDRIAIGDVLGEEAQNARGNEIVVASDDNGGQIAIYNPVGLKLTTFKASYYQSSGFAVGNVIGDSKAEILIASGSKVLIYTGIGQLVGNFNVRWHFGGVRQTGDFCDREFEFQAAVCVWPWEAFMVGDVVGDDYAEIVMIEGRSGAQDRSLVHVFDKRGNDIRKPFQLLSYHHDDGAALGNIFGDAKKELLVATHERDRLIPPYIGIYNIATGSQKEVRYWPVFTKYDGFACGNLSGTGTHDQILIVTDESGLAYIGG